MESTGKEEEMEKKKIMNEIDRMSEREGWIVKLSEEVLPVPMLLREPKGRKRRNSE